MINRIEVTPGFATDPLAAASKMILGSACWPSSGRRFAADEGGTAHLALLAERYPFSHQADLAAHTEHRNAANLC